MRQARRADATVTTSVAVLIPVLNRPERVKPLVQSLAATATVIPCVPVFIASPDDDRENDAIEALRPQPLHYVVDWQPGPGDYPRKINHAFSRLRKLMPEYLFFLLGADDLVFHPGWVERAVAKWQETHACVIGTNDLGNSRVVAGKHATHPLVHRDYGDCGTADEPKSGKLYHEGYDHQYCNPPDAPIWMSDLSFKPIGEISVGDRVIGWEYDALARPTVGPPRRSLCYSDVLAVSRRVAPLVRIVMGSGREFVCTPDHRWLNALWMPSSRHDAQWVAPAVGRSLLRIVDQPEALAPNLERDAGWLAGIYDGEGSGIVVAAQSDGNREVVEEISRALDAVGVRYRHSTGAAMNYFVLQGGRQEYLSYLLRVRPVRRDRLASHIVGYRRRTDSRSARAEIGARRFGHRDPIVAVEALGESREVVSMTTSSGNYVAHGYASRNCDDEFVQTAQWRGTYEAALDSRVEHLHPDWGKAKMDETYRKGKAQTGADRALYLARKRLWEQR